MNIIIYGNIKKRNEAVIEILKDTYEHLVVSPLDVIKLNSGDITSTINMVKWHAHIEKKITSVVYNLESEIELDKLIKHMGNTKYVLVDNAFTGRGTVFTDIDRLIDDEGNPRAQSIYTKRKIKNDLIKKIKKELQ